MLITSTGYILARKVVIANTFLARLKGLMGQRELPRGTALLINPCNQVHMFFMRFDLGIIFLDPYNKVLAKQHLKPWQISSKITGAKTIIEACPEVLTQIREGDFLQIKV